MVNNGVCTCSSVRLQDLQDQGLYTHFAAIWPPFDLAQICTAILGNITTSSLLAYTGKATIGKGVCPPKKSKELQKQPSIGIVSTPPDPSPPPIGALSSRGIPTAVKVVSHLFQPCPKIGKEAAMHWNSEHTSSCLPTTHRYIVIDTWHPHSCEKKQPWIGTGNNPTHLPLPPMMLVLAGGGGSLNCMAFPPASAQWHACSTQWLLPITYQHSQMSFLLSSLPSLLVSCHFLLHCPHQFHLLKPFPHCLNHSLNHCPNHHLLIHSLNHHQLQAFASMQQLLSSSVENPTKQYQ